MTDPVTFLDGRVTLYGDDCIRVLAGIESDSIDAIVTDPPYGLEFMGKGWDGADGFRRSLNAADAGRDSVFGRTSQRGPEYRAGALFQEFMHAVAVELLRVLKPGGHLVAFGGTRTYHRMACAIEDAGFDVRDQVGWAFGQGFPKSLDVSKAIDKAAGAEREVVGTRRGKGGENLNRLAREGAGDAPDARGLGAYGQGARQTDVDIPVTSAATDAAREWEGWGTALKPAWEPICLARKPLIGTVAENVQRYGTGAMHIDACRITVTDAAYAKNAAGDRGHADNRKRDMDYALGSGRAHDLGRWPANFIHDGSEEVLAAFPRTASGTGAVKKATAAGHQNNAYGKESRPAGTPNVEYGDEGSAARFFYTAKADADDRIGSKHPTVKPVDLMRWLCRLITPPGGTILDPFAGTGTTGEAAYREGFSAVLIEREAEYQSDIARRMELVLAGPAERKRAIGKAKAKPDETAGPLFGGSP